MFIKDLMVKHTIARIQHDLGIYLINVTDVVFKDADADADASFTIVADYVQKEKEPSYSISVSDGAYFVAFTKGTVENDDWQQEFVSLTYDLGKAIKSIADHADRDKTINFII